MWHHLGLVTLSALVLAQPRFGNDDHSVFDFIVSMVGDGANRWNGATSVTIGNHNTPGTLTGTEVAASRTTQPTSSRATTSLAQSSGSNFASGGSGDGYMPIVDEWRAKLGLGVLAHSNQLEGNALRTVQDGNGQMVHELNPGSMAQVLAPGGADEFEHVFVGGWLCERPDLPGLDGVCSSMSQGWSYGGETGHADILVAKEYSKIGCALAVGIWGCDLA